MTNGTRVLFCVLVGLVLALMGGVAHNALANADTNQRVAWLEAQNEYIIKSLDRIEQAVNPARHSEGESR